MAMILYPDGSRSDTRLQLITQTAQPGAPGAPESAAPLLHVIDIHPSSPAIQVVAVTEHVIGLTVRVLAAFDGAASLVLGGMSLPLQNTHHFNTPEILDSLSLAFDRGGASVGHAEVMFMLG